jgi:DNA mismatch repair protein MutS
MDKEFIMATAKTTEQQILWSINKWEYMSWGVRQKAAIEYEGMATLALRVSGAVHKGWVFISLNEEKDCYEVRLLNVARTKVKRTLEEVYCDNLGEVLDGLIERKAEWTDEQYKRKAASDSARKMGMEVLDTSKNNSKTEETMAKTNDSAMVRQYKEMKAEQPDRMLLFRCGDFYETYGEDAKEAAKILGITLTWRTPTMRHAPDDYSDAMAGFPHHALDSYLPKLLRAGKRVAICDQLPDPPKTKRGITETINNNNNQTSEDKTMATKKNETKNVQDNAQVNNNAASIEDVNVGEVTVDSIMPVMQPVEGTEYTVESDGKTATFESMAPNIEPEKDKPERKVTLKRKTPQTESTLPMVRLVVYTTKRGEQAPRIEGFSGEDDPRWKRHYEDKVRLAKEKKEADAFNEKLTARMKGKPKAEREKLRKQWKSVGSDPFGASYFTDRTDGSKNYQMIMGTKYMEVARELVDAYNGGDEQAIAAAEQAVIDCKNGIVRDIEAQRDAKRAEREAKKSEELRVKSEELATASTGYSDQDVAEMLRKVLAGGDVPENIKKLLQAA